MNIIKLIRYIVKPYIYYDAQEIIDLWLNKIIKDKKFISYVKKFNKVKKDTSNSNNSFFLLLFNTLYDIDQVRIRVYNQSSFFNNLYGENKSDIIKTIYNIEKYTLNYTDLIYNYINELNITTKDISKIRKLTELLSQINEDSNDVIANILFPLFKNSREEESLFDKDNIDYMAQYMSLFNDSDIQEEFIKSDAFKSYLPNMINDNKIEEIKSIINNYTNEDVYFENLKSTLTNIFDLNLHNNELLKDFIKQTSYKLIVKLICMKCYRKNYQDNTSDIEYSDLYTPLNEINEKNITDIDTKKLKKELDENRKKGSNLPFDYKDIPDQFNRENFIGLCFKVLSRITDSITYQECETIHNQLFKTKSKQINSSITPKEIRTGVDNNTANNMNQPHQPNLRQPINLGY